MKVLHQSPTDTDFVQNPYPFYRRAQAETPVAYWQDYGMLAVFDAATVQALLRDRRLGRAIPADQRSATPDHLVDFAALEAVSMLDREPPSHTRLRGLVLRAFTSRQIAGLAPQIEEICHHLIADFPRGPFDLLSAYCTQVPVRIIARLLGVPEAMWPELLRWSNAMVAMYQAGRTHATEVAANTAARAFTTFLTEYITARRDTPRNDLITELIRAETDTGQLTSAEVIGTCVLLLNAGHEATVHTLGNAVKTLLEHPVPPQALSPAHIAATVEEVLRFDPPLHIFTRYAYEDIEIGAEHRLAKGAQVALVLGAAGRDPTLCLDPDRFEPTRAPVAHAAFGGGLHFCLGAPLARLELQIALATLFHTVPTLSLAAAPHYADSYHFHGLDTLTVTT